MVHEAYFILLKKEKAKNSFEARKLVAWTLEEEIEKRKGGIFTMEEYDHYIGGYFSGVLSDICGEKTTLPYYNEDMRNVVREKISRHIPWIKEQIEKSSSKTIGLLAKDLKAEIPEFKKYTDSDLLDAISLELYPMGIGVDFKWHIKTGEVVYNFSYDVMNLGFWENGRYWFTTLGYEDDAMITNECLYREIIDKKKEKVKDIEKEKITSDNVIGKKWIVVVDIAD